ncbi:hypothetical protein [Pyxidicoccus sp. MSG2]|uniref:hypothetical protein n=1 Tax=Pyxidicoccus sp. MSG2 TaxID=2996790 RepID=UPI0022714B3D|nr:hypothetical protein [Pyxidicoccus sp. MSG2]MCY1018617.1 hypothetical protein [Pyxidicoccus sp. MSG2]
MQPRARYHREEDLLEDILGLVPTAKQGACPLLEGTPMVEIERRDVGPRGSRRT